MSAAIAVLAVSSAVTAQSSRDMNTPEKSHKMNMTYTGCVEAVNHGGSFFLTHVSDGGMAMKDGDTHKDHMTPNTLVLTGRDLNKHVGQKVTITGPVSMDSMATMRADLHTLAVASLKVVAMSCAQE
jgi:hypothetical protein